MEINPAFVIISIVILLIMLTGIHHIEEGHVGIYFYGGALLPGFTEPGYHLKLPIVTTYENVQVTIQTDQVTDIPCGTSGGVMIYFGKIEVVNKLKKDYVWETIKNYTVYYDKTWIFDKIHHEINQFCSSHTLQQVYIDQFDTLDDNLKINLEKEIKIWAPGIEIISIRFTKPKIPKKILENYEAMEKEKTSLLYEIENYKVIQKRAETRRKEATIEAKSLKDVAEINMKKRIMEKEAQLEMEEIQNKIYLDREKAKVDADYYAQLKEIESLKLKLTEPYLSMEALKTVGNNTVFYFGKSIPQYFTLPK